MNLSVNMTTILVTVSVRHTQVILLVASSESLRKKKRKANGAHETINHFVRNFCHMFTNFYCAMLCIRGTSHGPVSVCLSQVGVLLKRLNRGSHKQYHTIAQGL